MLKVVTEFDGVKLPFLSDEWVWVRESDITLGICRHQPSGTSEWLWLWYMTDCPRFPEYHKSVYKQLPYRDEQLVLANVETTAQAVEAMYMTLLLNMCD